jgi:hypothetical protein
LFVTTTRIFLWKTLGEERLKRGGQAQRLKAQLTLGQDGIAEAMP